MCVNNMLQNCYLMQVRIIAPVSTINNPCAPSKLGVAAMSFAHIPGECISPYHVGRCDPDSLIADLRLSSDDVSIESGQEDHQRLINARGNPAATPRNPYDAIDDELDEENQTSCGKRRAKDWVCVGVGVVAFVLALAVVMSRSKSHRHLAAAREASLEVRWDARRAPSERAPSLFVPVQTTRPLGELSQRLPLSARLRTNGTPVIFSHNSSMCDVSPLFFTLLVCSCSVVCRS